MHLNAADPRMLLDLLRHNGENSSTISFEHSSERTMEEATARCRRSVVNFFYYRVVAERTAEFLT